MARQREVISNTRRENQGGEPGSHRARELVLRGDSKVLVERRRQLVVALCWSSAGLRHALCACAVPEGQQQARGAPGIWTEGR